MTRPIHEEERDGLIGGLHEAVHASGGGGDLRKYGREGGREGRRVSKDLKSWKGVQGKGRRAYLGISVVDEHVDDLWQDWDCEANAALGGESE